MNLDCQYQRKKTKEGNIILGQTYWQVRLRVKLANNFNGEKASVSEKLQGGLNLMHGLFAISVYAAAGHAKFSRLNCSKFP